MMPVYTDLTHTFKLRLHQSCSGLNLWHCWVRQNVDRSAVSLRNAVLQSCRGWRPLPTVLMSLFNVTSCLLLTWKKNCLTSRLSGSCQFVIPSCITLEHRTSSVCSLPGLDSCPGALLLSFHTNQEPCGIQALRVSPWFLQGLKHMALWLERKKKESGKHIVWKILRF